MANAILTVNAYPNGVDNTQRRAIVHGTCNLNNTTYITGGIPLPANWVLMDGTFGSNAQFTGNWGITQTQPQDAFFFSMTGATGYQYEWDQTTNNLRIYEAGVELASAAAITADTIGFEAQFIRGI